jgi:hypothetical protein
LNPARTYHHQGWGIRIGAQAFDQHLYLQIVYCGGERRVALPVVEFRRIADRFHVQDPRRVLLTVGLQF